MANFNRIVLVGNLTRDPQLKYLPSQMAVADFGLAVNHKYKTKTGEDREEVLFIDCSIFGRGAEVINQYCQKGKPILVEGRLRYETWEDKQGGGKRSKHSVTVENFQLLGGPGGGGGGGAGGGGGNAGGPGGPDSQYQQEDSQVRAPARPPMQRPAQGQAKPPAPQQPFGDEQQFKEDDIPF